MEGSSLVVILVLSKRAAGEVSAAASSLRRFSRRAAQGRTSCHGGFGQSSRPITSFLLDLV